MSVLFDDDATLRAARARARSRSGWARTSPRARSTRPRWRATTPAPPATAWLVARRVFVAWMLLGVVDDELVRAEVGYLGAATLLCGLLALVYRRG